MELCIEEREIEGVGVFSYSLICLEKEEYDFIKQYGIAICQKDLAEESVKIEDLDTDKDRVINFVKLLAKMQVTCTTLFDVCEDYVVEKSEPQENEYIELEA